MKVRLWQGACIVCVYVCLCLPGYAAEASLLADARALFAKGSLAEAQMLVDAMADTQQPLRKMLLQVDIHLAHKDLAAVEKTGLVPYEEHRWPLALRPLALQTCADYYTLCADNKRSAYYYRAALRAGGSTIQPDRCVFRLAQVAYAAEDLPRARRYAQVLWRTYPQSPHRIEAGLLLAHLIPSDQPVRARTLLTALRLLHTLTQAQRLRADELLITLLIRINAVEAERLAAQILAQAQGAGDVRVSSADDVDVGIVPVLHVQAIMQHDSARGYAVLATMDVDRYPLLAAWSRQGQRIKEGTAQREQRRVEASMQRLYARLQLGQAADVLQELAQADAADIQDYRFAVLALEAGAEPHGFLGDKRLVHPILALCLAEKFMPAHSEQAFVVLANIVAHPYAASDPQYTAYLTVLLAYRAHPAVSQQQQAQVDAVLMACTQRHRGVGELWAREAQKSPSRRRWLAAVSALPVEHPWYGRAVERLALLSLSAVPPGTQLRHPSLSQRQSLAVLVEHLSVAAWRTDDEQACRCRYMLGQALAQLGHMGEALLCFESLQSVYQEKGRVNAGHAHRRVKLAHAIKRLRAGA